MAQQGLFVSFPSENAAGPGRAAIFGDAKASPLGLIVIHEWWGMNQQIQDEAAMIAKEGNFTVLVPDLYRGKLATDREEAGHLMKGLDWTGALTDLSAAANCLKARGCTRVGVMGFCMGGALSFAAAVKCPEISAAAAFYGIPNPKLADLTTIKIPIQAHFGEKDAVVGFSSPGDYNPLRVRLMAAEVPLEMYTYDAGHGFTNFTGEFYDKDVTALSLSRVYEFMHKNLKSSNL